MDVLGRTAPTYAPKGVGAVHERIGLPSGLMSGDVTSHEAVIWARGDAEGRLMARLSCGAHIGRVLHGPSVDATSDFTGRLDLTGLTPGREYDAAVWFEARDGTRGEVGNLGFRTAAPGRRGTSFVWTGATAGQGWGINPDLGGMTGYAAMHGTNPDFFVHAGDVIHADAEIAETRLEPDGQIWRNLVTREVTKVAESLVEYRGRHTYNLLDENVRAMNADVPMVPQWDDHETRHGWLPGRLLDDERYTERRTDVLATWARRAWQEFQPIGSQAVHARGGDGFASARIYRRLERGPLLDLFCLDMRVPVAAPGRADAPGPDSTGSTGVDPVQLLGAEQADWLVREVSRSPATWKVVVADLPLGLVRSETESAGAADPDLARVLRGLRDQGARNVVWISSGLRYAAVHHYHPERATFTDFDPFWEFVAGPINAGTATVDELDPCLGPRVEFVRAADHPDQSPRAGHQFFGHVRIDPGGAMTVSLRDARGRVQHSTNLDPEGT